jgi:hypothetical protein
MADLAAVRDAVADSMAGLDVTVHPRLPDQLQTPCIVVEVDGVDWATAMGRGHELWTLLLRVLVGTVNNTAAQEARDEYFGGVRDVKDAVESYAPLKNGTAAASAWCRNAQKFDGWEYAGIGYLGVEIVVEIRA